MKKANNSLLPSPTFLFAHPRSWAPSGHKQKGTVLILALLLLVMVEIILVSLLSYHHFGVMYTQDLKKHSQAMELMLGGEKWAIGLLKHIKVEELQNPYYPLSPTQTPSGVIQGQVWDAQALVNLNNYQTRSPQVLENFLRHVLRESPEDVETLVGFLSPSQSDFQSMQAVESNQKQEEQEGTETEEVDPGPSSDLSKLLYSVTQLLVNTSISSEGFAKLLGYVTVLPEYTGLNVNTASRESLYALHESMAQPQVEALLALRQEKPLDNLEQLTSLDAFKGITIDSKDVVFDSRYYLAEISVIQEDEPMKLYTLMKVTENDTAIEIEVLWRSLGTR